MSKLPTLVLMIFTALVGVISLFAATQAGSIPFAIQMATMSLWSVLFLVFITRRSRRP